MNNILIEQAKSLYHQDIVAYFSNLSALLNEYLEDINWVGFYFVKNDNLVLGPFQGKVACTDIEKGKGVCGTSLLLDKTILVEDVHKFEGHIACDSASNSEIVIPIHKDDKVFALLDIDSPSFSRFTIDDQNVLTELVKEIESRI